MPEVHDGGSLAGNESSTHWSTMHGSTASGCLGALRFVCTSASGSGANMAARAWYSITRASINGVCSFMVRQRRPFNLSESNSHAEGGAFGHLHFVGISSARALILPSGPFQAARFRFNLKLRRCGGHQQPATTERVWSRSNRLAYVYLRQRGPRRRPRSASRHGSRQRTLAQMTRSKSTHTNTTTSCEDELQPRADFQQRK
jgi:hypothetical protein